jgi:hypothetical protein
MTRMSPWAARLITGVVVAAAVGGALALCFSVPLKIAIVVAGVIVVFTVLATVPSWGVNVGHAVCASLLALLALVAVAVVTRWILDRLSIEGRLPIWLGLVLAVAVFFGVALWYLHGDWLGNRRRKDTTKKQPTFRIPSPGWPWKRASIVAGLLAVLVVLVPPLAYGILAPKPTKVTEPQGVVSHVDVLIVSDRPRDAAAAASWRPSPTPPDSTSATRSASRPGKACAGR